LSKGVTAMPRNTGGSKPRRPYMPPCLVAELSRASNPPA